MIIDRTITTKTNGTFDHSFEPDSDGDWSVIASWEGDELHESTISTNMTFEVMKVQKGIPGFPYESVLIGVICAFMTLWLLQKKQ